MALAGGRTLLFTIPAGRLIAIVVRGFIPIAVGIGLRIIHGVARFITGVGSAIHVGVGAGGRTLFGGRPG